MNTEDSSEPLPRTYSITLFHVSDIHWPENSLGGESFEEQRKHSAWQRFISEICEHGRLSANSSAHNILVLGGDNVAESNYSNFPSFQTSILEPLLALRRPDAHQRSFFDSLIAVPGNHDIERGKPDKFDAFRREFRKIEESLPKGVTLVTPFSESPVLSIETPFRNKSDEARCIRFWAVNSAEVCGYFDQTDRSVRDLSYELLSYLRAVQDPSDAVKQRILEVQKILAPKIRPHDPGYVNEKDMILCRHLLKEKDDDLFRVAVIHHNSIPFVNDDNLKYKFWNANEFNSHLIDHRFRLLLHGHQHVGEACLFSKSRVESRRTKSYLADGFLSIGAPAFDSSVSARAVDRGFSIVQLQFSVAHDICEVQVQQVILEKGKTSFARNFDRFDLALERIPESDSNRWLILPAVNRILYSKQRLDGLMRAVDDPRFSVTHSSTLRGFIGKFQEIKALYALSVFPPAVWVNTKVPDVFLPFATDAYGKAVKAAERVSNKAVTELALLFSFSSPLCKALKTAASNSRRFPIVETARKLHLEARSRRTGVQQIDGQRSQAEEFLRKVVKEADGTPSSSSVWARATYIPSAFKLQSHGLYIKELNGRAHESYRPKQKPERRFNSSLCEFPRIVLWDRDSFRRPSALDVIEYHENLHLPLFWINLPSIVDQNKNCRRKVGYVAAIAMNYATGRPVTSADVTCHWGDDDKISQTLAASRFWEEAWGAAEFSDPTGEERLCHIDYSLGTGSRPLHEYIWLLARNYIMFASDVWVLANSDEFQWDSLLAMT